MRVIAFRWHCRLQSQPMKNLLHCLFLFLLCSSSLLAKSQQTWREDRAQLCFVRPENNGSMNILESWVRFSDYNVSLVGGQAVCIFVIPGSDDLRVTSTVPYQLESTDEEACKSPAIRLKLAPNEKRVFFIGPTDKDESYECGWRIEPLRSLRSNPKKTKQP